MRDKVEAPRIEWLREPTFDSDGVQVSAGLSKAGEHPDPVPLSPPIGLTVAQGDELHGALRRLFREEREKFMGAVDREGFESEEEANDFDVAEDIFAADSSVPWDDRFTFSEAQEAAARADAEAVRAPAGAEAVPSGAAGSASPAATSGPVGPVNTATATVVGATGPNT